MGLFGGSDDTGDADDGTNTGDDEVSAVVEQIRNGELGIAHISDDLGGPTERRIVTARALARVVRDDTSPVTENTARLVDTLAERHLARPIADSLLGSANELAGMGVTNGTVARGGVDALDEAHDRLDEFTQSAGHVPGGGASEVALGAELREYADGVDGRESLVIEATADSLEAVASALARQAGLDPLDTLVEMRSAYLRDSFAGIDTENGRLGDGTDVSLLETASDVRARITDGVVLGLIVFHTSGTVSPLEALTGYDPSPAVE